MSENNQIVEHENNLLPSFVIAETDNYTIHKDNNGKYSRKAKYSNYSSFVANNREEKIWLLNLFEGADDFGQPMKDHVGDTVEVQDIITRPYDRIDEDTGVLEYGVLTYLITPEREVYVTSAKSVYFSINRIMEVFGKPRTPEWEENIKIEITKTKMENGDAINIKMVG